MAYGIDALHLTNFKKGQNYLEEWFLSKDTSFYCRSIYGKEMAKMCS